MANILIVEDDFDIHRLLERILQKENFLVTSAFSGTEAELRFSIEKIDLVVTDLMLPGLSGEDLIKKIRKMSKVPIIAISAKGGLDDKVLVLEAGADDYITKPFEPKELIARVKAQLRRNGFLEVQMEETGTDNKMLSFRNLILDTEAMSAKVEGEHLELTVREFEILKLMMAHPNKVFSKEALYESIWKDGYYGEDNTISVHVSNIRKKIEKLTQKEYIATVWGIGYKLKVED